MSDEKFVHLHNHSYFSILDGLASPEKMAETCVKNNFKSIALTDHGSCGGWYQFQKACQAKEIKPILGNEVYTCSDHTLRDPKMPYYHLVLLAKNRQGVRNLMKLSTISETRGKYRKPRIDFDLLKCHSEGLICLSACCVGELPMKLWHNDDDGAIKMANEYRDVFGDDFYIEIMMHKYYEQSKDQQLRERQLAKKLYNLSKHMGIKAVCSNDSHYASRADAPYHDVMLSMQTHNHIKNPKRFTFNGEEFYIRPYEEMHALYKSAPEMLSNTVEVAEKIEKDALLVPSQDLLPVFDLPSGFDTEEKYLKTLVKDGMQSRGFLTKPEYRERIRKEMNLIVSCGFVRYFLTLWDIINYARQQGVRTGVGRGCFTPDTKVQCKSGVKLIKDVKLEDRVLSYDGKYHEITNLLDYDVDEEMIEIEMEDGRKFTCTSDHKIHINRNDSLIFVEASELTEEDEIFDIRDGVEERGFSDSYAKIKKITKKKYKGKVYDLTVPDLSAYNVDGLSVHNSGAGSLCLYVLGITKLDPIKYGLLFERFINPERVSPPDVDIDFDYYRRDEIFDYIIRKYGEDYCCKIGTYNTFKARASIRYAAKALDIGNDWETYCEAKRRSPNGKVEMTKKSLDLADSIAKQVPLGPGVTIESAMKDEESFRYAMHKYPKLMEATRRVENAVSSAGVHPAGIIVCKEPIVDHIPLRESKGSVCSQFVMEEVEELGLLKFDMLALKTLTIIENTVQMIKKRYGTEIDIDEIEPNDPEVFKLLNGRCPNMDNRGIFQFESYGMSKLLKNIRVDSFTDMVVCNALYRPGPLGAGVHDLYSDYKHGRKKIEYLHPKMGEVLDETYGIMVFQEDLMKVVQKLAGFTLGQADWLRKVVGKKKIELIKKENLDTLFIEGCKKHSDINEKTAKAIFEQIEYFGGYGFNKCLHGETTVFNEEDNKTYRLDELEKLFFDAQGWKEFGLGEECCAPKVVLKSFKDNKIIEDEVVDVFEVGERELFEVEMYNGVTLKCTMDHKFICSDGKSYTLQHIIDNDLEILYENN